MRVSVRGFPGLTPYLPAYQAMRDFTARRGADTPDEIWLLQHPPVYTLGQAGRPEHLLAPGDIPVYHIDRGGQVTYHGPGQLVAYVLLDLKRRGWYVKRLVTALEQAVIDYAGMYGARAERRDGAPGVYVAGRKLAALGLRVRRGCCYHGLSLNVDLDLEPFRRIDPCGYPGLEVTCLRDLGIAEPFETLAPRFAACLLAALDSADDWDLAARL